MPENSKINITFICHGNICRSPMAEYIFKDLVIKEGLEDKFFITSHATSTEELGNGVYYRAEAELDFHKIGGYENHSAKQFRASEYDKFDYLVIMDGFNEYNLLRIIGSDKDNKVHKLLDFTKEKGDIEDPWYTRNFDKVFNQIDNGCRCFLEYLKTKMKA